MLKRRIRLHGGGRNRPEIVAGRVKRAVVDPLNSHIEQVYIQHVVCRFPAQHIVVVQRFPCQFNSAFVAEHTRNSARTLVERPGVELGQLVTEKSFARELFENDSTLEPYKAAML